MKILLIYAEDLIYQISFIGAFKLLKSLEHTEKEILQMKCTRIYGTAWRNEKELEHLKSIEEAEKETIERLGKIWIFSISR